MLVGMASKRGRIDLAEVVALKLSRLHELKVRVQFA